MHSENLKTLFLAWQAPDRQWFPIGRLSADVEKSEYQFDYIRGALSARDATGFKPLVAFPDFEQKYSASELFPLFTNRILTKSRKGFSDYIRSLDLDPKHLNMLEVLAITGGERQTDSFEVFRKIYKEPDGSFKCRFFLHGLNHVNKLGAERATRLKEGEHLQISVEINNPKTKNAIQLSTQDYLPLGWTPRYLVSDLLLAMSDSPELKARVVKVNSTSVPLNRRYLIEMNGIILPKGIEPMAGKEFQPIH